MTRRKSAGSSTTIEEAFRAEPPMPPLGKTAHASIQEAIRSVPPGTHSKVTVRTVAFESSRLVEITDALVDPDIRGAFVKVRPTIRASDRASWDGPTIAAQLRRDGARGVVLAPVVIPDEGKLTEVARAESPTAAIDAWFSALPGVDPEDREAARQISLGYLSDER